MTAVEEGSFSAAARKLYLSQSALPQQISIMENELGVKLFDRKGYRPALTEAGITDRAEKRPLSKACGRSYKWKAGFLFWSGE